MKRSGEQEEEQTNREKMERCANVSSLNFFQFFKLQSQVNEHNDLVFEEVIPPSTPSSASSSSCSSASSFFSAVEEFPENKECDKTMAVVFGEVLELILEKMDTPDLFNCRQVSKRWLSLSDKILRNRPDNEMKFTFCPMKKQYVVSVRAKVKESPGCSSSDTRDQTRSPEEEETRPRSQKRSLIEFANELYLTTLNGDLFPCDKFRFSGGNLGEDISQIFFDSCGVSIRRLCLDINDDLEVTDWKNLCFILFHRLPNLEHLKIVSLPRQWEKNHPTGQMPEEPGQNQGQYHHHHHDPGQPPEPPALPKLTHVEVGETNVNLFTELSLLIHHIILAAPALQQIFFKEFLTPNFIPIFLPHRLDLLRIHSISLSLFFDSTAFLELLSRTNFPIRSLTLDVRELDSKIRPDDQPHDLALTSDTNRRIVALSTILDKCAHTLTSVTLLADALEFFVVTGDPLPILFNVSHLSIDLKNAQRKRSKKILQHFPPLAWKKLARIFPQVEEVTMDAGLDISSTSIRNLTSVGTARPRGHRHQNPPEHHATHRHQNVNVNLNLKQSLHGPGHSQGQGHGEDQGQGHQNFDRSRRSEGKIHSNAVFSVKTLNIKGYPSPETLRILVRAFPAVEKLKVSDVIDFHNSAGSIWKLRRLRHLKLRVIAEPADMVCKYPAFDEDFMGCAKHSPPIFSKHASLGITKDKGRERGTRSWTNSILDLTHLQCVDLTFVNYMGEIQESSHFISAATTQLVFEQVKNLDWQIHAPSGPDSSQSRSRAQDEESRPFHLSTGYQKLLALD